MRVGIHQPNYIPWGGYFYKILKSDVFIFLDDVQYTKNSLINRNQIKTSGGVSWLTVPVNASITDAIREVRFAGGHWKDKHIKTLEMNYKKAACYAQYADGLFEIIKAEPDNLARMNMSLIRHIAKVLGATCEFVLSSEHPSQQQSDDRLIELLNLVGGDAYLSGKGGASYQSEEKFAASGIRLEYTSYTQQEYPQRWGVFESNMSIVDILFNCGEKTRDVILGGGVC